MTTALYVIWGLIPIFFLGMALWSWLEKVGGKKKQERPGDFFRQGIFVLVCVGVAILVDQYALEYICVNVLNDMLPLGLLQVVLLPIILYIGARILGPSKDILISQAPSSAKAKKTSKRIPW